MVKRAQSGNGIVIVFIIIVIAIVGYLYYSGFFSKLSLESANQTQNIIPIGMSVSSPDQLGSLYPSQQFHVVSMITNNGTRPFTVSLLPYGCPTRDSAINVMVYPGTSDPVQWNFTAPSSGGCDIQFTACFNDVSYADYPVIVKNQSTSATPPVFPTASVAPISLSIPGFSSTVLAPPVPANITEYIRAVDIGNGFVSNGTTEGYLAWLDLNVQGANAYIQLANSIAKTSPNINVTSSVLLAFAPNGGALQLPFLLTVNPVSSQSGYYGGMNINISSGYRYCIQSQFLPVSTT